MKKQFQRFTMCLLSTLLISVNGGCAYVKGFFEVTEDKAVALHIYSQTDTSVVLYVENAEANSVLLDAMYTLQEEGKISFQMQNGMLTELNGKKNTADWSQVWMLYTSDVAFSNTAWGSYPLEDMTLGSAIVGAESLPIKAGEYYVWSYQTF